MIFGPLPPTAALAERPFQLSTQFFSNGRFRLDIFVVWTPLYLYL